MYNPVGSPRLRTASPINRARINSHLRLPSYGSPYGLGGLSRRDRQGQSVRPCPLVLLMQRSPWRVGRPTSATCGHAGARRGWQKAERCCRVIISGRTCGDMRSRKIPRLLWGRKPAATQRLPRAAASASPRRMVSKGFFFPPHLSFSIPLWGMKNGVSPRSSSGGYPPTAGATLVA